jgi:hypothetical protein
MADEIDQANETAERFLSQALANIAKDTTTRSKPKGRCYFCEDEFEKNDPDLAQKLFCDQHCSKDYEHEQRLRARK